MAKVLIIGCGDLGSAIAHLLQKNHLVVGLRRSNKTSSNMQTIQADVTQPSTLTELEILNPNIVIYCVSADAQTDESYLANYVTGLKNILVTQRQNVALQHVFFVSSTRVYGQITDEILDENMLAIPADFGGARLLEAENSLKQVSCKSTSMRLSGIYGNGRLYLANMAKEPARWPADNHWSNRIHRDDAAGFIALMVENAINKQPLESTYIVTDDMPTQQYEVLIWLAQQQGIDTSHIQLPAVSSGKRLSNKRLRSTGFGLQYPNYQVGYGVILNSVILKS